MDLPRIIIKCMPENTTAIRYLRREIPEAEWVFDQKRNAMDTFKRGLEKAGEDPVVFMEDDIILAPDWRKRIGMVVAFKSKEVINFFSRRDKDITIGSRYDSIFSMNQCHYNPAGYSRLMLEYLPGWMAKNPKHPTGYDIMMSDFLKERREQHWLCCPSVVQHVVGASRIGRRAHKRISKSFELEYGEVSRGR